MIWLWLICFSALWGGTIQVAEPASFRGRIELKDSRDSAVRKRADYSGVVVSLHSLEAHGRTATPAKHAEILQKDKMFRPHLLAVETGAIVDFPNADPIFHNAFSSYSGQVFDIGLYPPGTSRSVRFARPGVVRVFCNIHPAMSAVIVVLDTAYFAVTGSDGQFKIEAPPGTYQMRIYHERATEESLRTLSRTVQLSAAQPVVQPVIQVSEAGYLPSPHKNKHGRDYAQGADDRSVYPGVRK
jgi:plastocyanin